MSFYIDDIEKTGSPFPWVENDGGRAAAGLKGYAGDCGVRAVAITLGVDYRLVYAAFAERNKVYWERKAKYARIPRRKAIYEKRAVKSAQQGIATEVMAEYLLPAGYHYVNLTEFGEPPARFSDLPSTGRHIVLLRKHFTSLIDGVVQDTFDPQFDYDRPVYGFFSKTTKEQ